MRAIWTKENKLALTILASLITVKLYFDQMGYSEIVFLKGCFYFYVILTLIYGIQSYFKSSKLDDNDQEENG